MATTAHTKAHVKAHARIAQKRAAKNKTHSAKLHHLTREEVKNAKRNIFERTDYIGLISNLFVPMVLVVVANTLIFLGGYANNNTAFTNAPSPAIVGTVWIGLFALMGLARWEVLKSHAKDKTASNWIVTQMIVSLLYPLYTAGFDLALSAVANVVCFLLASFVAARSHNTTRNAGYLLMPQVIWTAFATIIGLQALGAAYGYNSMDMASLSTQLNNLF